MDPCPPVRRLTVRYDADRPLCAHRPRAHWPATPVGRPFARAAVLAAARWREAHAGARCGAERPAD
ncbi:hypothetical protein ABZV60_30290 [Streptomyces sp. NPDC004787]|uniref:hypothetical protein n=1 Tax=Streptomyces sp. NPDC004787 TaxID=3154291 RepID=UPI0033AAE3D1